MSTSTMPGAWSTLPLQDLSLPKKIGTLPLETRALVVSYLALLKSMNFRKDNKEILPMLLRTIAQALNIVRKHYPDEVDPYFKPLSLTHPRVPNEIRDHVISYIVRPADLKNLCLTCKTLRRPASRILYREVCLDLGASNDVRLSSFLHHNNREQLKHVRELDLYLATEGGTYNPNPHQANFVVRMLIEFLPENVLEKFSWHPWAPFSADNLLLLYRKQRNLKWIESIRLDRPIVSDLASSKVLFHFASVQKLGLYPDSRSVLEHCHVLVRNAPRVEKLTLHANFTPDDPNPITARELNDSSTGPGLMTSTIFKHLLPFDEIAPANQLSLKELTLTKINLRFSRGTYCKFINLRSLETLKLISCPGADAFLEELRHGTNMPTRLRTLEFKHNDDSENVALHTLEEFLEATNGLRELCMDLTNVKSLPSVDAICQHGETLRTLIVHGGQAPFSTRTDHDHDELVYSLDKFKQICTECTNLEQLSVAFPITSILREPSDLHAAFISVICDLPHLITLHITTWPDNAPALSPLPYVTYETLLAGMAARIFQKYDYIASGQPSRSGSCLSVLAFGNSDKCYDREDSKNQMIYAKGKKTDLLGRTGIVATKIGWCMRRYAEPRSDVLDFSLSKTCKPPTREGPGAGGELVPEWVTAFGV